MPLKLIRLGSKLADDALETSLTWLSKRRPNVSKHVGYHTVKAVNAARRNARYVKRAVGNGVHSVFRDPRPSKLVKRVLKDPDQIVDQGSRWVVEKTFGRAIGKAKEQIVRVVIDPKTGRVITAFPVKELLGASAILLSVSASASVDVPSAPYGAAFDESVMSTIKQLERRIENYARLKEKNSHEYRDMLTEAFLTYNPIGLLFYSKPAGGDPDMGFIADLRVFIDSRADAMILEMEEATQSSMTLKTRQSYRDQFTSAVLGMSAPYPAD